MFYTETIPFHALAHQSSFSEQQHLFVKLSWVHACDLTYCTSYILYEFIQPALFRHQYCRSDPTPFGEK